MLEFVQTVKDSAGEAAVSVFADAEKGHTVYVTHSGALYVAESEKKGGKTRAAGFALGADGCRGCEGC